MALGDVELNIHSLRTTTCCFLMLMKPLYLNFMSDCEVYGGGTSSCWLN